MMVHHRPHPTTIARTEGLKSPLGPELAALEADPTWLFQRAKQFMEAAGIEFQLWLDPNLYRRLTREQFHDGEVAQAYRGPVGARWKLPVIVLNRARIPDRGTADQVLAHEIMHLRWPSYGHKAIAFRRAQAVLDNLGPEAI